MARVALLASFLSAGGCFYLQAAHGQLEVLAAREPIPEVITHPDTPHDLAERLRLVQEARDFSIESLGMPDNGSYRSYADLGRDYVLWSIFATPELSLDPLNWCYPVVGCVAYRGYFRNAAAVKKADELEDRGFDVHVAGVPAYSTLGRFDDPVLNTMLRWDDLQLVATLFHELAHQLLYIPDDAGFNESFATAVEEIAVERFLAVREATATYESYRQRQRQRRELMALVDEAREDLRTYFSETLDDDEKRLLKEDRLERLAAAIGARYPARGATAGESVLGRWNNARLLSFSLYEGWVPAFRQLYENCARDLECFYAQTQAIGECGRDARDDYLEALATRSAGSAGCTAASASASRRVSPVSRQ